MITQQYHGDVAIIKGLELPEGLKFKPLPAMGTIVAYGEASGHSHTIVAERAAKVEIAEQDGKFYLKVNGGNAKITHQEHAEQTLTPGIYTVFTQVEYDDLEELRKVSD